MINGFDIDGMEIDGPEAQAVAFVTPIAEAILVVPPERRSYDVPEEQRILVVRPENRVVDNEQ